MDNQNINAKQALLEKLQQSTNILVTVSNNPSVDQLAACLGLTIWLNKVDKHATAVFSGEVPNTLEFLEPQETLEKNTDSLRDFIIALDKSKADKLRYKVEDSVVKVFVTPYRTSLSADDLEFSQGDFNVDMVIALGVTSQEDIDTAITAHGRILHDATVATINVVEHSELGAVNWFDEQASSLSELVTELGNGLDKAKLDSQIATALLTGVVAETDRFSNEKTTPQTMTISGQLMSAGANQQLVAAKLEEPKPEPEPESEPEPEQPAEETAAEEKPEEPKDTPKADGTLEIDHQFEEPKPDFTLPPVVDESPELPPAEESEPAPEVPETPEAPVETPEEPERPTEPAEEEKADNTRGNKMIVEPPALGGTLTANSRPEDVMTEPSSDPLSLPDNDGPAPAILGHPGQPLPDVPEEQTSPEETEAPSGAAPTPVDTPEPTMPSPPPAAPEMPEAPQPAPPDWMPPQPWMNQPAATPETPEAPQAPVVPTSNDTLEDIERSVHSPHLEDDLSQTPNVDSARDEVMKAINSAPEQNLEPVQALNAQPIDLGKDVPTTPEQPEAPEEQAPSAPQPVSTAFDPSQFEISNDTAPVPGLDDPLTLPATPEAPTDPNTPVSPELTGPVEQPFTMPLPGTLAPPVDETPPTSPPDDPTAPPPVPPPMYPPAR